MIKDIDLKINYVPTKGYAVFQKVKKIWGYKWIIISTYKGTDTPMYFSSYDIARDCLLDDLRLDIACNSTKPEFKEVICDKCGSQHRELI